MSCERAKGNARARACKWSVCNCPERDGSTPERRPPHRLQTAAHVYLHKVFRAVLLVCHLRVSLLLKHRKRGLDVNLPDRLGLRSEASPASQLTLPVPPHVDDLDRQRAKGEDRVQLHHVLHAFQLDNVVRWRLARLALRSEVGGGGFVRADVLEAAPAELHKRRPAQPIRFVVATGTPMRKQPAPANVTPPFRRIGEDGHARSVALPVCVSASLERERLAQRKQPEHLRVAHAKAQPALQDAQLSFDSCALE